jgi:AraC family transcriptional regulator
MRRSENQFDKIFVHTSYLIHYRRQRRIRWSLEPGSDYSLLFVIAGKLTLGEKDRAAVLNAKSGLLLNPGDDATALASEAEFFTFKLSSAFVLDCAVRAGLLRSGSVVNFHPRELKYSDRVSRTLRELAEELTSEEAGKDVVIAALVEQLVVQLLRDHSQVRRSPEMEVSRAGLVDRRIRRAVELMHAHMDRDLPLDEIAAAAFLSPFHFSRLFKKLTGNTPHAYLAGLRTARAETLLAETDLSITEISARVGYASPSHFTKAFRQSTGLTPRGFRAALVRV